MSIDILICTIDEGVAGIGKMLLPPQSGVHYVVSAQYTGQEPPIPEEEWTRRPDVTLTWLQGRGLSRNRNNALHHATGDIIVISDDDCRYLPEHLDRLRAAWQRHPEAEAICFAAESHEGRSMKRYPKQEMPYGAACRLGYYPTSMELTFRRKALQGKGLLFNTCFGLGTDLPAGEEDILLTDCQRAGLQIRFVPEVIVRTDAATTGDGFLQSPALQITKGAVFRYHYGLISALWRTLKEGLHHGLYNGHNPLPIWRHMLRGIHLKWT